MTVGRLRVLPLAFAALALAAPLGAQAPAGEPALRRVEVSAGGGLFGGSPAVGADATLRGREGDDYRLFSTESRIGGAPALELRGGFALTPRYALEGRLGVSRPQLQSSVSNDVEGAPPVTLVERIDQYLIEGALLVTLDRFQFGPAVPFAAVGAGYLRQLHEGLTLVEHGTAYHAGGGVRVPLFQRDRGLLRSAGLRGDGRVYLLSGGAGVHDGLARHLAGSVSFFVRF